MNPAEKVVGLLTTLLAQRERERAPARPARVLGRHQDGTEALQRLDATCVTRASRDNHYAGSVVLAPALSPIHRTGTTGIPPSGGQHDRDVRRSAPPPARLGRPATGEASTRATTRVVARTRTATKAETIMRSLLVSDIILSSYFAVSN